MDKNSIYQRFNEICSQNRDSIAYRYKESGKWVDVT